ELTIREAATLVSAAVRALEATEARNDSAGSVDILLGDALYKAMEAIEERRFCTSTEDNLRIDVEREIAGFVSWYELFPRSITDDPNDHGTFRDVIAHFPHVQAMGFNVVYFPPIHPIGKRNRKGKNNNLVAEPHEP